MSTVPQVYNGEFRDFAAVNKYPFTDDSTYMSSDGRIIPLSYFLDIILYPISGSHGRVRIHGIRCLEKLSERFLEVAFSDPLGPIGTAILSAGTQVRPVQEWAGVFNTDEIVVGTIVMSGQGVVQLVNMAGYASLFFNPGALEIRPDRVVPVRRAAPSVSVGGRRLPITCLETLDISVSGPGVVATEGPSPSYTVTTPPSKAMPVFTDLVLDCGYAEQAPLWHFKDVFCIRTPPWSNIRIATNGPDIAIGTKGDAQ